MMSVLIFPMALVLALFAPEVLRLWTGNADVAANVAPIVRLLIAGSAINGIMWLPYALQLANGWTSLGLAVSVGMCVVMVPSVYILAASFGGAGAAAGWLIVNLLNLGIAFPLTHRRLLRGEALTWFARDICGPLAGAAVIVLLGRRFITVAADRVAGCAELGLLLVVAYAVAAFFAPAIRNWSRGQLRLLAGSPR
jgi:O-antigen/teichoic acid export membrane protein